MLDSINGELIVRILCFMPEKDGIHRAWHLWSKMSQHYKRRVKMLEQGKLEKEIERLVADKNYQTVLRNLAVLVEDNTPAQRIKLLL